MGRGVRRDRARGSAPIRRAARARRVGDLPRQPERAQPRRRCSTTACCSRRSARSNVYSREHRRPDAEAGRGRAACSAAALTIPVPDVDRTDYLLMLGANPFASNGSLCTAPDFPGRLQALRARGGKARRRRPAADEDGRGGRRARCHPARHRRAASCSRSSHVLFAEGLVDLGRARRPCERARRGRGGWPRPFTPERVAPAVRHRRRRRSGGIARELAAAPTAAVYGRIGTSHAGVRHARVVARRRRSTSSPATSTAPGGAMFTHAGRRRPQHARRAGQGPRRALRPRRSRGARAARVASASCPVGVPGRGDRDAGRRPDPRADHASPATRCSRRRTASRLDARARVARLHGERRHLPERDDAARRRDPARRRRRCSARTTTSRSTARDAQRRELLAAGAAARAGRSPTSGRSLLRLAGVVGGPGRRRRRRRARRPRRSRAASRGA